MNEAGRDELARQRFGLLAFFRLTGLALMIGGLFIGITDLVKPGGWPLLGAVLVLAGAGDALFVPWFLRRQWRREGR